MPKEEHKKELPKDQPAELDDKKAFIPKTYETGEVRMLLEWEAASRPFRKKDRSYYTTSAVIVILLCLILLLAREFLLIAVLLSLTFVAYVLAFVPPHPIKYRLSTQGITIGEDFYFWHLLDAFWFKEKEGHKILIIQTRIRFPGQLMLVLNRDDEEVVKKIVARFLPYIEVPHRSFMEKWAESLQKNFPLENVNK